MLCLFKPFAGNNPILRHHHRYHKDDSDQQIIIQREGQYPQLHQKIRIRVRSTSTDKGAEINNNQNHVNKSHLNWITRLIFTYLRD